jgi:hypothetical protein
VVDTGRRYKVPKGVFARRDGDGLMVYAAGTVAVHTLNSTMAAVFEGCDGSRPCEELAAELVSKFQIGPDAAAEATYEALRSLLEHGLVEAA